METRKKRKISDAAYWVLIAVLGLSAVVLVLSNFDTPLKLRVFSVNSGSMQPSIKVGSLVLVRPKDEYVAGDVITYRGRRDPNQTTTHRIVSVSRDEDLDRTTYVTKGDANEDEDPSLTLASQVIGKVSFKIPLLGYLVAAAKTQLGFTFLVVIPATIIVYSELINVKQEVALALTERKEKGNKKGTKKPKKKESVSDIKVPKSKIGVSPLAKKKTSKKTVPKIKKPVSKKGDKR